MEATNKLQSAAHNVSSLRDTSGYRISGRSANDGLRAELWKDFEEMPGPAKIKLKDYAVMNVAPSVIPTYFPGVRVFTLVLILPGQC